MATNPVNPAVLNALVFDYGRKKADLDDQENRRRINYNSALDKMRRNYQDVELRNRTGFSDRGMIHSGASIANQMKLKEEDARQQSEASLGLTTDLATLARRRLETEQEFQNQKLLATLGLTATK